MYLVWTKPPPCTPTPAKFPFFITINIYWMLQPTRMICLLLLAVGHPLSLRVCNYYGIQSYNLWRLAAVGFTSSVFAAAGSVAMAAPESMQATNPAQVQGPGVHSTPGCHGCTALSTS